MSDKSISKICYYIFCPFQWVISYLSDKFRSSTTQPASGIDGRRTVLLKDMKPTEISEIADMFVNDTVAYQNRRRLYDLLNLSNGNYSSLEVKEPYSFFRALLDLWISENGKTASLYYLWEICHKNGFKRIADDLKTTFPTQLSHIPPHIDIDANPIEFGVNDNAQHFTGRSKELATLQTLFHGNAEYIVTITGMGGVGKSELARRFAYSLYEKHGVTILWFNGQNKETLQTSIVRLAKLVRKTINDSNPNSQRAPISTSRTVDGNFLESVSTMKSKTKKRKLVIIDNVDEANEGAEALIKSQIPEKDCFFLITSRNLKVLNFVGKIIELDIFTDEDAQHLVSKSIKGETKAEIKNLCKLLQNFPLALQQSVAYIKEQKHTSPKGKAYKITDYVDNYEKKKKECLGHKLHLNPNYELTTLITWIVTTDKIKTKKMIGKFAMEILNYISYFQPDGIHTQFLQLFFPGDDVNEAIPLIKTYGLIKCEDNLVSVHRLLQQVMQLKATDKKLEIRQLRRISHSILRIFHNGESEIASYQLQFLIEDLNKYHLDQSPSLLLIRSGIHVLSVWNHLIKHRDLVEEFKQIPNGIINVMHPIPIEHQARPDVTDLAEKTYARFKTIFGEEAIETLELELELLLVSDPEANAIQSFHRKQTRVLGVDNVINKRMLGRIICHLYFRPEDPELQVDKYVMHFLRIWRPRLYEYYESVPQLKLTVLYILLNRVKDDNLEVPDLCRQFMNQLMAPSTRQHQDLNMQIVRAFQESLFRTREFNKVVWTSEPFLSDIVGDKTDYILSMRGILSASFYYIGDPDKAFTILEQELRVSDRRNRFSEIKSSLELADVLVTRDRFQSALDKYEVVNKCLSSDTVLCSEPNFGWWKYEVKQKSAECLFELGRCQEAGAILSEVLRYWEQNAGGQHELTIGTTELLAEVEAVEEILIGAD